MIESKGEGDACEAGARASGWRRESGQKGNAGTKRIIKYGRGLGHNMGLGGSRARGPWMTADLTRVKRVERSARREWTRRLRLSSSCVSSSKVNELVLERTGCGVWSRECKHTTIPMRVCVFRRPFRRRRPPPQPPTQDRIPPSFTSPSRLPTARGSRPARGKIGAPRRNDRREWGGRGTQDDGQRTTEETQPGDTERSLMGASLPSPRLRHSPAILFRRNAP